MWFALALSPRASSCGVLVDNIQGIHLGIPTRDRDGGGRKQGGGPSPALPGNLVRRQDHKASAAWPNGRSWGWPRLSPSAPEDLTGKVFRSQGWPGRVQRAARWREGTGFCLRPLRNLVLFSRLGCLESWLLGLRCRGHFLFSLFPLRTSDCLPMTCLCGYLSGEMVFGFGARCRIQASRGWRSKEARSPGHGVLSRLTSQHPSSPLSSLRTLLSLPPHTSVPSHSFFLDLRPSSVYSFRQCILIVPLCQAMV